MSGHRGAATPVHRFQVHRSQFRNGLLVLESHLFNVNVAQNEDAALVLVQPRGVPDDCGLVDQVFVLVALAYTVGNEESRLPAVIIV